jgi:hypothetical protein
MYAVIDPVSGQPRALSALEKADARAGIAAAADSELDEVGTGLAQHVARQDNPHNVSADDLGLGNVDNTRDVDKPVSTLQQQAITSSVAGAVTAPRIAVAAAPMSYEQRCALLGISTSTTAPDPALYRWYADAAGAIHYSNGTAWSTI